MVGPDPSAFDRLTGKHHALHLIFGAFRRGGVDQLIENEYAAGRLPILSLPSTVAPADIAPGRKTPGSSASRSRSTEPAARSGCDPCRR